MSWHDTSARTAETASTGHPPDDALPEARRCGRRCGAASSAAARTAAAASCSAPFSRSPTTARSCGEALHHHRADDAPAYFVILIVGHIVVPLALVVEVAFAPPYWLHAVLWLPLTLGLAIGLLQPVKGAIVGWQWANYMHGFDPQLPKPRPRPVPIRCT